MKQMTRAQLETTKARAASAARNLRGDEDRAEEFEFMSVEDYAAERGITITNPFLYKGERNMASRIKQLEEELSDANRRIEKLENERLDALEALGVEIVDEDEDGDDETEDEDDD
jgi:hypothetical protein